MKARALFALLAILFFSVSQSFAHSSLVSATPAENAVLSEFPTEIVLEFNENLLQLGDANPNKVEVRNSMGDLLSSATVVNGSKISAPLQITGNDEYEVSYRIVSGDGHVVEDSYKFKVESEIATAMPISAPVEEPEDGPNLLVRSVMTLAAGAAFLFFLQRKKKK
jgi:methionine-rich copper-binding protein CopC